MKKFLKTIIALAIIAAIAFGVYFIFNNGTDNKQIRAKVYSLNNNLIVDDINIYTKTNGTVDHMINLINQRGYTIPDEKAYLITYSTALEYYDFLKQEILVNGLFVNNQNTNDYFKNMNKAYDALQKIYTEGNEYLLTTYYAVTDESLLNVDYIVNFSNTFKDALTELNNFYYNAGMAFSYGTKDMFNTNNGYKLKVQYYSVLVNTYIQDYLDNKTFDLSLDVLSYQTKIATYNESTYFDNKAEIDSLMDNSKLVDIVELAKHEALGQASTYISSLTDADKRSATEKYYNLVIKG